MSDGRSDVEKPHPQMGQRPSHKVLALAEGDRVRLLDGSVREVTDNPRDGVWIMCRPLGGSDEEELVAITDIQSIEPRTS